MDDKDKHKIAGNLITLLVGGLFYLLTKDAFISVALGFISGCIAGFAKEYYDLRVKKTKFDWWDLGATLWGTSVGTIMLIMIIGSILG